MLITTIRFAKCAPNLCFAGGFGGGGNTRASKSRVPLSSEVKKLLKKYENNADEESMSVEELHEAPAGVASTWDKQVALILPRKIMLVPGDRRLTHCYCLSRK